MKQLERILKLRETDANDSEDNDDGVIITIEMQSVIPIFSKLKSVLGRIGKIFWATTDLRVAIAVRSFIVLSNCIHLSCI